MAMRRAADIARYRLTQVSRRLGTKNPVEQIGPLLDRSFELPAGDPRYGNNARIQVSVTDATGEEVVNTTSAMNDAGGFTYTFVVPTRTAVGDAAVTAMPYNIDWCDDTGRNNRVAGAREVSFVRVSCAVPVKPLTITR